MHFTVVKNALVPADNEARKLVELPLGSGVDMLLASKDHRRAYAAFTRFGKAHGEMSGRMARDFIALVCGYLRVVKDRSGRPVVVPMSVSDLGKADFELFWENACDELRMWLPLVPIEHADELRKLIEGGQHE